MALQIRRGTDAERKLTTFAAGEIVYTTDTKKVFVGDGSTLGGKFIGGLAEAGLRTVITYTPGGFETTYETEYTADGHLAMLGNDIVGIRDLVVERNINSNLVPPTGSSYSLGSITNPWGNVYANTLTVNNTLNADVTGNLEGNVTGIHYGDVRSGSLYGDVWSTETNRKLVDCKSDSFDGIFEGPLYGSVYSGPGGDSTVVLNSVARVLTLAPRSSAPPTPTVGMFAVADSDSWDPAGITGGVPYPVFFNGTDWIAFATTP